ncbi:MAG: CDP-alcohol phosphatidyltransferase family protein [Candidatus Thorarchaeota archaeon]|jgi:CDP-diacylglycerol--glycerol-3-phosphate 3-phosphatidyltransferase/archaetidylinositol phosphate synthase
MLGKLRERYQKVMMPVGRALAKTGITPNMITGLTLLVALVSAYFFFLGDLIVGFLLMLLTVVMDMFDGAVARAADLGTKFGATFDHTLDRYAEFLFILGLMMGPTVMTPVTWWAIAPGESYLPWFWGIFALFGMIMASFSRAKAESVGGMENCSVGIAERQEKLILTFAGILLLALPSTNIWLDFLALLPVAAMDLFVTLEMTNILTLCVAIVGILSHITVIQRLAYARKAILQTEGE